MDPFPVGQEPGDQPLGFEGLPDGHGGLARAEQGDEFLPGLGRPGHGQRLGGGGEVAYDVAGEREFGLGGRGGGAQDEHRVPFGAGGAGEDDLAVGLDDAVGERAAVDGRGPAAAQHGAQPGADRAGAQHPVDLAPGDVGGVRDGAGGLVHLAQQRIGVEEAEVGGDLVLLLEGEAVGGAAGREVQCVAGVQQDAAGLGEPLAGCVGDPGGGDGAQGGGVAESAAGLLEVGFQEELELALAVGPFAAEFVERGQAFGGVVAPVGEDRGAQGGDEAEVPGDGPGVEEAELHLEVLARRFAGFGGGAYGVVEGEAEVPDRVPDVVGECGDGSGVGGAVVQEQQVEVAARGEFAAAVAADGDEGGAADTRVCGRGGEEGGQPVVGERGEGRTARRPGLCLLLEEAQPGRRIAAGSRVLGFGGHFGTRHPTALPFTELSVRVRPGRVRRYGPGPRSRPARSRPCRHRSCRSGRP